MIMETGRVCMKIAGREAGRKCVVVSINDANNVTIIGQGVKKRKCNIKHLEPLEEVVKIKKDATEDQILKSLK